MLRIATSPNRGGLGSRMKLAGYARGSPTRKDSLRPEGDVAYATEGGRLASASETERLYEDKPYK